MAVTHSNCSQGYVYTGAAKQIQRCIQHVWHMTVVYYHTEYMASLSVNIQIMLFMFSIYQQISNLTCKQYQLQYGKLHSKGCTNKVMV